MESKYSITNCSVGKANRQNTVSSTICPVKRKLKNGFVGSKQRKKGKFLKNMSCVKTDISNPNDELSLIDHHREDLPVYKCRQRLLKEIEISNTILVMAETGSGKTTQIPQIVLDAGYGANGIIGVTQPRRVAAITIAKRVAHELECNVGDLVGYTVRFEDCTSNETRIKFLTDGSLLREALSDRLLCKYSVIMLDEAHERTVNTDVLLSIVKEAQKLRSGRNMLPLKIIIASATMDIEHFSNYFAVRGLYLEGRTHPVRVMHSKLPQTDYLKAALVTLLDIHRSTPTSFDVLIFLTGQEEIDCMAQQIRQLLKIKSVEKAEVRVFPLYAQLPQSKQMECFLSVPNNVRKIVLATNIAETSITIPGIRCVIDCGYVKQNMYNADCDLEILRATRISQAQAWQRCGRAGRNSSGICYRTYTLREMQTFCPMTTPEILRCNVSSTVLQLLALGVDFENFDFLDSPLPETLCSAYRRLASFRAIESATVLKLTELGRDIAQFPLDPKYALLLLSASNFGCMEEMLSLVAVLSSENIFVNNIEKGDIAFLAHSKFTSKYGDHLSLLNVFTAFKKIEKSKRWCHDNYLNLRNLTYASKVRDQLIKIVNRLNIQINSCGENLETLRKCLITGLFDNIAVYQRDNYYLTLSGRQRAKIHPSSVLHGKYRPECVVFTEVVLTEEIFLRQITEICPEWIEEVVPFYEHKNGIKKL